MIKFKIQDESYSISTDGTISTMDKKSINPKEWCAKALRVEAAEGGFKTISLKEAAVAINKKVYLSSEQNGQPKLEEVSITEVKGE